MLKVGLIILALIAMVGTTTTKAFASDAVTPLCTGPADTGGGMNMAPNTSDQGSGGGGSSTGSSDTMLPPPSAGNSLGGHLRPFEPEPAVQQGEWYQHHHGHLPSWAMSHLFHNRHHVPSGTDFSNPDSTPGWVPGTWRIQPY